ncbi:MAG: TetR/AcrR family transcriptional regulator [Bacteroidaceae bacterium]
MEEGRRKRRTKVDIENLLLKVAHSLIAEKGFNAITLRAITQKARIEPIVFYNRYDDMENFLDEFVKEYDYWLAELNAEYKGNLCSLEGYKKILNGLFDSLYEDKIMQQLLRWEVSTDNPTTQRTAGLREFHTIPLVSTFKELFKETPVCIEGVSALIIGGIYYLITHARLSHFAGIDINTEEGRATIHQSIDCLAELLFNYIHPQQEIINIIQRMKEKGLEPSLIAEYTGLEENIIQKYLSSSEL